MAFLLGFARSRFLFVVGVETFRMPFDENEDESPFELYFSDL